MVLTAVVLLISILSKRAVKSILTIVVHVQSCYHFTAAFVVFIAICHLKLT